MKKKIKAKQKQAKNVKTIKNGECSRKLLEQCWKQAKGISVKKSNNRWINLWQNKILDCSANGATVNLTKMLTISI